MFAATQIDINGNFDVFAEINAALYGKDVESQTIMPKYGEVGPFEMPMDDNDITANTNDEYTIIIDRVNLYDTTDIHNYLKHLGVINEITLIDCEDIQTGYTYQSAVVYFDYMYATEEATKICNLLDEGINVKMIIDDEDDMNSWIIYKSLL